MNTNGAPHPAATGDEVIIGWRCWFVLPHEGILRPIFRRGLIWRPGEAQAAICPDEPHDAPAEGCMCGLYAVCHPMLLNEIHWDTAPPEGIEKLPGVLVIGQVSMWGRVIQHERGWRAQHAYPTHLYVFTTDTALAETLRERYRVPVACGDEAERLRRTLPPSTPETPPPPEKARPFPACLLTATQADSWPAAIREMVDAMLEAAVPRYQGATTDALSVSDPDDRYPLAQKAVAYTPEAKRHARRALAVAAADVQVKWFGTAVFAQRALWVRLARWQRTRAARVSTDLQTCCARHDEIRQDLERGTVRRGRNTGMPYAPGTLVVKRCDLGACGEQIEAARAELTMVGAVVVPSYREWREITRDPTEAPRERPRLVVNGVEIPLADFRGAFPAWYRLAIAYEWRLARERDAAECSRIESGR